MSPTREQFDALIAKWRERTRAPIPAESLAWHTAAEELAACLAAAPPEPKGRCRPSRSGTCPTCGGPRPCDRCTTSNVMDLDALKEPRR